MAPRPSLGELIPRQRSSPTSSSNSATIFRFSLKSRSSSAAIQLAAIPPAASGSSRFTSASTRTALRELPPNDLPRQLAHASVLVKKPLGSAIDYILAIWPNSPTSWATKSSTLITNLTENAIRPKAAGKP